MSRPRYGKLKIGWKVGEISGRAPPGSAEMSRWLQLEMDGVLPKWRVAFAAQHK